MARRPGSGAGPTDEQLAALERVSASALALPRRVAHRRQTRQDHDWTLAGERLAERAITALVGGDPGTAERFVRRMTALPPVQDDWGGAGPVAVNQLLYREVLPIDPESDEPRPRLEATLAELAGLDGPAAAEVRHILAASTDYELPRAVVARIRSVVPLEAKHDAPFQGARDPEVLVPAMLAVLGVIARLRATDG